MAFFFFQKFSQKTIVLAHDGDFHTDDISAVATVAHLCGGLNKIQIVRSRDPKKIATADVVVDVGQEYDPARKRFDHHQPGGAGKRENGIPYAAFGLVWKEYGIEIVKKHPAVTSAHLESRAEEIAGIVEQKMVMATDALDNGVEIGTYHIPSVGPYLLHNVLYAFAPTWKEKNVVLVDVVFEKLVKIVYDLIDREIKIAADLIDGEVHVLDAYEKAADKRIVVLDHDYPWKRIIAEKPETLFVVYPKKDMWGVRAVKEDQFSFKNRKNFPAAWAGLTGEKLATVSGVSDALFCHNQLFTVAARTKEGAIALAHKAIDQ